MSKTKSETDKLTRIEKQIAQLKNKKRQIMKQEKAEKDKERIRRQSNRGGLIEKLMPQLAKMTDSEFEKLMKNILPLEKEPSPSVEKQGGILTEIVEENEDEE